MEFSTEVISKLLDVYPTHAALIDEKSDILAVNRSWAEILGCNEIVGRRAAQYYFSQPDFRAAAKDALNVDAGISKVLSGASERFTYNHESGTPEARYWFRLTAVSFRLSEDKIWAILLLDTELSKPPTEADNLVLVCGWCKRLPEGDNWVDFDEYFSKTHGIRFSHGICPECSDSILQEIPVSTRAHAGV